MAQQGKEIEEAGIICRIIRSGRRTLALQVQPDGSVVARAPYRMAERRIRAFIREKAGWIEKQRGRMEGLRDEGGTALSPARKAELKSRAEEVFRERVAHFAPLVGVTYTKITIRDQKTRWGSCSRSGSLNFNLRLLLAPAGVLDYVVVHELCHRLEMNHSAAFWAEVERVLPDYRESRRWLKENGWRLMDRQGAGQ